MTAAEDRATAAQSPHISNLGCCMLLPASLNQTHGMRLSLVMMSRIVFTALVLASIVLAAGTAIGPQLEGRAPLDQSPQQEKQAGLRTVTITEICPSSTSSIQTPRTHLSHGLFPNPLEADTSAAAAEMDLARNHPSLPASAAVDSPTKRTLPYFIQCPEGWTWLSRHCATHSKHAWKDLCRDDRYGSEVYHMCEKWQKCAKGLKCKLVNSGPHQVHTCEPDYAYRAEADDHKGYEGGDGRDLTFKELGENARESRAELERGDGSALSTSYSSSS